MADTETGAGTSRPLGSQCTQYVRSASSEYLVLTYYTPVDGVEYGRAAASRVNDAKSSAAREALVSLRGF
jgi:hypothetical protein